MSCLEMIESMGDLTGARVLDLGAGTGILGIAALRSGASYALLVDTDPRAVEASRRHAELNRVADRVDVVHGQLADVGGDMFDIAFANIHGDVLIPIAGRLVDSVRPGGRILLSGIAWEWTWPVRDAYERRGCRLMKRRFLEEFSTMLLVRPEG
jgi:ribosomal protein L11 methyltransferase